jgi:hypothetical protein
LVLNGASYEDQFDLKAPKLGFGRGVGSDTPKSVNQRIVYLARPVLHHETWSPTPEPRPNRLRQASR